MPSRFSGRPCRDGEILCNLGPMALKIIEEHRPIGCQVVNFEIAQRKRESVVNVIFSYEQPALR